MRLGLPLALTALCFAMIFTSTDSQLTFGANGLRMPPINLATVYKILKKTWNHFMNGKPAKKFAETQGRETSAEDQITDLEEEEIEDDVLNEDEKLIYNELKLKIGLECFDSEIDCSNLTMEQLTERRNVSITDEEKNVLMKKINITSLDYPVERFISNLKNLESKSDSTDLLKIPKSPTFLPFPFASAGWIVSYIILNSVLLGLYVFLAGPYFITGRTVSRFEGAEEKVLSEDQYMGYTTYGDSDMIMTYMMPDDEEDAEEEDTGETEEEETSCIENILCLQPAYGARALSSSKLLLKLSEWIPGWDFIGKKFRRNYDRLENAISFGKRSGNCEDYGCPKRRK